MKIIINAGIYVLLIIFAIIFFFPVLFTFTNSFMSAFEIQARYGGRLTAVHGAGLTGGIHFAQITLIPSMVTFSQYARLFFGSPYYLSLFLNSLIITVPTVFGQIILAAAAAYAFEMARFKFKEVLFFIYVVIMLLPLQVTIVPNFIMTELLNINQSVWAIILPGMFSPFGVFLMRQFLRGIQKEYVEAAKIDGAGHVKAFIFVMLPMLKTAVATLGILVFVDYWNVVDQAVVFLNHAADLPLSVYLARMVNDPMVFAASVFYMLPVVLLFLFGQEYMVEGIQLSGIK